MFDLTSSKLLLLGIVALIVIGPKDLPVLLRTLGKYVGIVRRQAAEFRSQFEEAVRESELADLRKEVENMGAEAEASMREAERNVKSEFDSAKAEVEQATDTSLLDKPAETPQLEKPAETPLLEKPLDRPDNAQGAAEQTPTEDDTKAKQLNGAGSHAERAPEAGSENEVSRIEQKAGA